jgi:hypothetical protein
MEFLHEFADLRQRDLGEVFVEDPRFCTSSHGGVLPLPPPGFTQSCDCE